jgi:hypothetical protein
MSGGLDEMSLETVEIDETQAQQGALVDYMDSAAEAVSHIKGAKEDVELIVSLLGDEDTVVEGLVKALTTSGLPVNRIPLEPSAMPEELGEVEEAQLTSEGSLIVSLLDGQVDLFDLSQEENRGLLVNVMEDLVPKLHSVLDGSLVLPELIIEEAIEPEPFEVQEEVAEEVTPPVPTFEEEPAEEEEPTPGEEELTPEEAEEPTLEEIPEEEVVEPEVEELVEEEPEIPEPPVEEDIFVAPELEEPAIEEHPVDEFSLPDFDPDVQLDETPGPMREKPRPPERPAKPLIARDAQVTRLRRAVKRQRSSAHIEMEKVRRQREAQIRRLRTTNGIVIPYGEQGEGLLDKLKGFISKRRKRR